jgi:hypothetical protein
MLEVVGGISGLVVILGVMMYYGVFNIVERGSRMGDRWVKDKEMDQVQDLAKKDAAREIDEDLFKSAVAKRKILEDLAKM